MGGKAYPLISVITPAYNHEKYIQETIQSILDQDYPNIEYIIIDDGSKDDTYNKILEIKLLAESKLTRFIAKTKENEGIIRTLNAGLSLANGEYVYIIASDDKATPDALMTLYTFMSLNKEYGLAVGDNFFMDENDKQCYWDNKQNIVYDTDESQYTTFAQYLMSKRRDVDFETDHFGRYETLIKGNYIPNGYLIRKSILNTIGGYSKEGVLEDYYLMLQIAKISKLRFLNIPLFYYRWHSTNTVKQRNVIERLTYKTILNEWSYFTVDKNLEDVSKKAFIKFTINICENNEQKTWIKEVLHDKINKPIKASISKALLYYKLIKVRRKVVFILKKVIG